MAVVRVLDRGSAGQFAWRVVLLAKNLALGSWTFPFLFLLFVRSYYLRSLYRAYLTLDMPWFCAALHTYNSIPTWKAIKLRLPMLPLL